MSNQKEKLFQALADAVLEGDEVEAVRASEEVVTEKIDAYDAINEGLSAGMERAGKLFEEEEYFVPELIISSDALYAGLDVLKPHIKRTDGQARSKVVIGVISGDTHDIGKNLVKIMLETAEFEVIDLGRDVPAEDFVRIAIEEQAEVIAISTLMTTTMKGIERVIRLLNERNVRDDFQVIVGGSPISQRYADRIGADGYSANASSAVELAKRLVAKKEAAAKASA